MTYQLRIAGAPEHRQVAGSYATLTPQALDLAGRGYVALIIETGVTSRGLEVHRDPEGVFNITEFNNTALADLALRPSWIDNAKADINHQISNQEKEPST